MVSLSKTAAIFNLTCLGDLRISECDIVILFDTISVHLVTSNNLAYTLTFQQ